MVLPQTSPEPALPLPPTTWKGNFQYNYKIVRFSNPMGTGQIHVSKIHFWMLTAGSLKRKESLAVQVLVCHSPNRRRKWLRPDP